MKIIIFSISLSLFNPLVVVCLFFPEDLPELKRDRSFASLSERLIVSQVNYHLLLYSLENDLKSISFVFPQKESLFWSESLRGVARILKVKEEK